MSRHARFCAVWLVSLAIVLGLVAAFNAAVDPYDVFGTPRIAGLNRVKSQTLLQTRLAKVYQIARVHPKTVLIGTSRVDMGLDPQSQVWPASMQPVYDMGLPGMNLSGSYLALRNAVAAGGVRSVLVMLDFEYFFFPDPPPDSGALGEYARRLAVTSTGAPNPLRFRQRLQDMFFSTLTRGAVQDSVATVLAQYQSDPPDLAPDGATNEAGFRNAIKSDGAQALFMQKEVEYAALATRAASALSKWNGPMPNLDYVRRIIALCHARGIALTLAIPPYHADLLDIFANAGLWNRFEQWKSELVDVVAQGGDPSVKLWDFSGYDSYTTEDVPAAGNRGDSLRWFWEPAHFKKALGDVMLRRMLDGTPADFGVELTPQTLPGQLARIRAERKDYIEGTHGEPERVSLIFSGMKRTSPAAY